MNYRLSVHHADYDKQNLDDWNLFAVCKRCNSLVNTNRHVWIGYFVAIGQIRSQSATDACPVIDRKTISQRVGSVSVTHGDAPDISDIFRDL